MEDEYMLVLTKVKRFQKKFYSKKLNRSFSFVGVLYTIGFFVGMVLLRNLPLVQYLFTWIPVFIAYLGIPIGLAYLLTGFKTEGRKPILYFRSYCQYLYRQFARKNYLRGRTVNKPRSYKMSGYMQYKDSRKLPLPYKGRKYKIKGYMTFNKG